MHLTVGRKHAAEKSERESNRSALHTANRTQPTRSRGFSLLELVIALTVLSILTVGVVPLVKVSVRRQREQRLREVLREMRLAIQEFHRDTYGMQCQGTGGGGLTGGATVGGPNNPIGQQGAGGGADPRSRVVISDCKIFTVDNPDRYPPDLETLVSGVNVVPRGGPGNLGGAGLSGSTKTATEVNSAELSTKKKVYLRAIPVDPITGEADWEFRSCYDDPDTGSWGKENVFDVRSKAQGTALNGEKYSDW
jgi:prepilin-type N-terminal cleavage/methylation domain-containing protein